MTIIWYSENLKFYLLRDRKQLDPWNWELAIAVALDPRSTLK